MRKIEVKPGYYEWNVYINGELFYSFDGESLSEDALTYSVKDGTDFDDINEITYEGLEVVADMYINTIKNETLEKEELIELKKQLVTAWAWHFGVNEA